MPILTQEFLSNTYTPVNTTYQECVHAIISEFEGKNFCVEKQSGTIIGVLFALLLINIFAILFKSINNTFNDDTIMRIINQAYYY